MQANGSSLSGIAAASRYLYVSVRMLSSAPLGTYRLVCYLLRGGEGWDSRHAVSDPVLFELLPERANVISVVDFGSTFLVKARPTVRNVTVMVEASEPMVDIVVVIRSELDGTNVEFNSKTSTGEPLTAIDTSSGPQEIIIEVAVCTLAIILL